MKSCQNLTRFDLGRLFAMHITQKNSEVRHSILHVDLIPITRLVGYLVLQLEKSDSKRYLSVFFSPKKSKICKMFWSMRRMTARVGAFESPDLGGPFRYLKHILLSSRKFFRDLWSRRVQSKWAKSQVKFRNFEMNFWKILLKCVFPSFEADICVVWPQKLVRSKALV